jgi:hypothetical protein
MSGPPAKIQKPPLLLLQGIAPHLFQSRTPRKPRKRSKIMDNVDQPALSPAHHKQLCDSSDSTRAIAIEAAQAG